MRSVNGWVREAGPGIAETRPPRDREQAFVPRDDGRRTAAGAVRDEASLDHRPGFRRGGQPRGGDGDPTFLTAIDAENTPPASEGRERPDKASTNGGASTLEARGAGRSDDRRELKNVGTKQGRGAWAVDRGLRGGVPTRKANVAGAAARGCAGGGCVKTVKRRGEWLQAGRRYHGSQPRTMNGDSSVRRARASQRKGFAAARGERSAWPSPGVAGGSSVRGRFVAWAAEHRGLTPTSYPDEAAVEVRMHGFAVGDSGFRLAGQGMRAMAAAPEPREPTGPPPPPRHRVPPSTDVSMSIKHRRIHRAQSVSSSRCFDDP